MFERVRARAFSQPILSLYRVDVDAKEVIATLKTFQKFISHPRTRICARTDQHAGIRRVLQTVINGRFSAMSPCFFAASQIEAS